VNPLVALLALIPLLVAALFALVLALDLIQHGPRWDNTLPVVVFLGISFYLAWFLRKTARPGGSLLALSSPEELGETGKRLQPWVTRFILAITYLVLTVGGIVLLRPESLRNWVGTLSFLFGLAWLYAGIRDLTSASRGSFIPPHAGRNSDTVTRLFAIHRRGRNLIFASHPVLALGIIWGYKTFDVSARFTLWDLSGVLVLLGSFMGWAILRDIALQKEIRKLGKG